MNAQLPCFKTTRTAAMPRRDRYKVRRSSVSSVGPRAGRSPGTSAAEGGSVKAQVFPAPRRIPQKQSALADPHSSPPWNGRKNPGASCTPSRDLHARRGAPCPARLPEPNRHLGRIREPAAIEHCRRPHRQVLPVAPRIQEHSVRASVPACRKAAPGCPKPPGGKRRGEGLETRPKLAEFLAHCTRWCDRSQP